MAHCKLQYAPFSSFKALTKSFQYVVVVRIPLKGNAAVPANSDAVAPHVLESHPESVLASLEKVNRLSTLFIVVADVYLEI